MTKLTAKTINYKLKLFNNMRKFIFLILVIGVCFGFLFGENFCLAEVPTTITLTSPTDGEEVTLGDKGKIEFEFKDVEKVRIQGKTKSVKEYHVAFRKEGETDDWFRTKAGTPFGVTGFSEGQRYYWRVRACSSEIDVWDDTAYSSCTPWCDEWSFTTKAAPLPDCSGKCVKESARCACGTKEIAEEDEYCCAAANGGEGAVAGTKEECEKDLCSCKALGGPGAECCPADKPYCPYADKVEGALDCEDTDCCKVIANCTSTPPSSFEYPPGIIAIENPLTATSFERIIDGILDFIFKIGIVLAPLMIIIGGLLFVTAAGNLEQVERAKKLIIWTGIGFIIILLSKGLLAIIEQLLGVKS